MKALTFALRRAMESRLYQMGFAFPAVRHLLTTQIAVTALAFLFGLILIWYSIWPITFGAGAAISTFSLWQICRSAQDFLQMQFSSSLSLRLFVGFSARLMMIGIVLFALIVWLKAPVAPLLLGLTTTVVSILLWGLSRLSRKTVKEA